MPLSLPSSSHSLFLPALFCSSVLTPFPFLSLQAKCEQPSGRVRPRLNRPLHASNFRRVFGGGKCYCRRLSAFFRLQQSSIHNSSSKVHSSGIFCSPLSCDTCSLFPRRTSFYALLFPPRMVSRCAALLYYKISLFWKGLSA